jgi:hypothetical protein
MNTEQAVLAHFCETLARATNLCAAECDPDLLADALLSAGAELLRKRYGTAAAAEQLRSVARAVEEQNPPEPRH